MTGKLTVYQPSGAYPDPHLWIEPRSLLNIRFASFEGLVGYDAHLNIIPRLAGSWKVSDDAREWLFQIRDNVYFHDGTVLTASDAAASIRNASRQDVQGAYGTSSLLYSYLGGALIEAVDGKQLRIRLPEPMADLPDLLVYIMIIPEACIGNDPKSIPGTGPFCLQQNDGNRFIFRCNENYWGKRPDLSELVFFAEKDPKKRVRALLEGEADIAAELEWPHTTAIDENDDYFVIEYQTPVAVPLMLNCSSGPFADVRVRQAVSYGTDVDEIIQNACGGTAVKLTGPLTRHHFGYDMHASPYPYDTGKAWQLLAEAGYADGLELTMYRPTVMPDEAGKVADCLKKQWARIGIKLHIAVQPDREKYALDVREKRIRDLCIFDSAPLSTWRVLHEKLDSSVQGPWWQGYDDPAFNALLKQGAQTVDRSKREKIYREAVRMVRENAPWVFLYSPVRFFGASWDVFDRFPGICQREDGLVIPLPAQE